jgi:hypothetical protein
LALGLAGCIERTLTITSEPPGAIVTLSSVEVGRTPVTVPVTWIGDYDVILRLEGHETLKTHHKMNLPLYEVPPIDLFASIAPWTYYDNQSAHFSLKPASEPPDEELIRRAEDLAKQNLQGVPK